MRHDTHDLRHLYTPIPYEFTVRGRIAVGAELPRGGAGHPDEEITREAGAAMMLRLVEVLRRTGRPNVVATLTRAASDAGLTDCRRTVHRWVHGKYRPTEHQVETLARQAGVDIAYLIPEEVVA